VIKRMEGSMLVEVIRRRGRNEDLGGSENQMSIYSFRKQKLKHLFYRIESAVNKERRVRFELCLDFCAHDGLVCMFVNISMLSTNHKRREYMYKVWCWS